MIEFKDRLPQNLGKYAPKAALAVSSLLMFGGTLLQARPINAEKSSSNSSNSDKSHSLYTENPGKVDEAIQNARLNIPKIDSLLGPEQNYLLSLSLIDTQGRARVFGVNHCFGVPPNNPDVVIGCVDDFINGSYSSTFQMNGSFYPELAQNPNRTAQGNIDGIVNKIGTKTVYLGTEVNDNGFFRIYGGEIILDYDNPNISQIIKVTSVGLPILPRIGIPRTRYPSDRNQDYLERDFDNLGFFRITVDSRGVPIGNSWFRVDNQPTITPTRTAIPSPSPTPQSIVRAGRFEIQNQSSPTITWQDGSMEDDYVALRAGYAGMKLAPGVNPLPKDSTSYTDPLASPDAPCYLIVARRAGNPIANSDLYCVLLDIQSPVNAPEGFRVGLIGNIANIGLRRTTLFDAYVVIAFNASGQRILNVPTDTITDLLTGPTCYIGAGVRGGVVTITNGLCAVPGIASGIN